MRGPAHSALALLKLAHTHTASNKLVITCMPTRAVPKLLHTALGLHPRAWCNNSGIALVGMQ